LESLPLLCISVQGYPQMRQNYLTVDQQFSRADKSARSTYFEFFSACHPSLSWSVSCSPISSHTSASAEDWSNLKPNPVLEALTCTPAHSVPTALDPGCTSGRLHCELERILFLQAHRETTTFLLLQELSLRKQTRTCNLCVTCSISAALLSTPSSNLRGNILAKATALRINLNIDRAPIVSRSHTHPYPLPSP